MGERSAVPLSYLPPSPRDDFGHAKVLAFDFSNRKRPGIEKFHYAAGLFATATQHVHARALNRAVLRYHGQPSADPRPSRGQVRDFLADAIAAGYLPKRAGREPDEEAGRQYQVMEAWVRGARSISAGDHGALFVVTALRGRSGFPHPTAVKTQWDEVVRALRAERNRRGVTLAGVTRLPDEHPQLNIIKYNVDPPADAGSSGAPGPQSTLGDMDDEGADAGDWAQLTPDEMEWAESLRPDDSWDGTAQADIIAAADTAVDQLIARGHEWLRDDVEPWMRYVGIAACAASDDAVGPRAEGTAMPYSVIVDLWLPPDYPERILRPGWALIDGWFVIDFVRADEQQRPELVLVLSFQDHITTSPGDDEGLIVIETRLARVAHSDGMPRITPL